MNLHDLIIETEKLGITVLFTKLNCKGRYLKTKNLKFICLNNNLNEIESINVLLHERNHFLNNDFENPLTTTPTYLYRIENRTEKERIINFINLINNEHPIDDNFNYIQFMKNAFIPDKFECFVKETAHKIYNENKKNKIMAPCQL